MIDSLLALIVPLCCQGHNLSRQSLSRNQNQRGVAHLFIDFATVAETQVLNLTGTLVWRLAQQKCTLLRKLHGHKRCNRIPPHVRTQCHTISIKIIEWGVSVSLKNVNQSKFKKRSKYHCSGVNISSLAIKNDRYVRGDCSNYFLQSFISQSSKCFKECGIRLEGSSNRMRLFNNIDAKLNCALQFGLQKLLSIKITE